jgi:hypothetical protein
MASREKTNLNGKKIGLALIVVVVLFVIAFVIRNSTISRPDVGLPDEVQVESDDCLVKVGGDGLAEYNCSDEIFYQTLDKDSTSKLFRYVDDLAQSDLDSDQGCLVTYTKGSATSSFFVSCSDNVIKELVESVGRGLDGGLLSEYFDDFFSTPQPTSTQSPSPTSSPPPPNGSDCPFWKIGMCVYPFPTPTPPPDDSDTVWDCALWSQQQSRSTIISDTVCIVEGE